MTYSNDSAGFMGGNLACLSRSCIMQMSSTPMSPIAATASIPFAMTVSNVSPYVSYVNSTNRWVIQTKGSYLVCLQVFVNSWGGGSAFGIRLFVYINGVQTWLGFEGNNTCTAYGDFIFPFFDVLDFNVGDSFYAAFVYQGSNGGLGTMGGQLPGGNSTGSATILNGIDTSGIIGFVNGIPTLPQTPTTRATLSSNASYTTNGTTPIPFNTVVSQSPYVTHSAGTFTVNVAGTYLLTAYVELVSYSQGTLLNAYVDGAFTTSGSMGAPGVAYTGTNFMLYMTQVYQFAVGTTFFLQLTTNSPVAVTIGGSTATSRCALTKIG